MNVVIGIDVGGSTTKIVGFDENGNLIPPLFVKATDPITSIYGAFGKFIDTNSLDLKQIKKIMMTGVGSSYITKPIYGLKCISVPEFECIGKGGLYISGLEKAIAVSMGTGTAIVYAEKGGFTNYLGGTGVGGGTIIGLSKKLIGIEHISNIIELAEQGDLNRIDLRISDIAKMGVLSEMPGQMTASNFGNVSEMANKNDLSLGILNMVFETIAMLALFAARNYSINDIVLTGNLTSIPLAYQIFDSLNTMFGVKFIINEHSQYATVIGAALSEREL